MGERRGPAPARREGVYFKRDAVFRERVTADGASGFPAASGRYHLYSAVACPWAHRAVLFRVLKELKPHVTLWNTAQEENGEGWGFGPQGHVVPGTDARVRWLHELYTIAEPACTTRVTVPTLWDAQTRKVVSNESSEIIRMFNSAFGAIAGPTPDYYPEACAARSTTPMRSCSRASTTPSTAAAIRSLKRPTTSRCALLFASLDALEERLARSRYLCGEAQTEADWRLFPSLVRFDAVYYVAYKCNLRRLEDYHNLSNYLRELYQMPGIAEACDIAGMKRGVYSKAGPVGANGIVPAGRWSTTAGRMIASVSRPPPRISAFTRVFNALHKRVYARL